MFRCAFPSRRRVGVALLAALAAAAPVQAQTDRRFSPEALRGDIVFGAPPQVMLDGVSAQLAPGARIRDEANRLLLTGDVQGQRRAVLYTTDLHGQPLMIWLLTDAERSRPWPRTRDQARTWSFDETTQRWTRP